MEINPHKYRQVKGTPKKNNDSDTSAQEDTEDEIDTRSWHKEKPDFGFEKVSGMEKLKKEREANPGVPISYDLVELEW